MALWKNRFRRLGGDRALDRELAFHIEDLTRANLSQGMSPAESRRQALVAFGGPEQIRQQLREVHSSRFVTNVVFNGKSALRFLRRSPSFSAAIILILALGIGLNSAVFSAMDAVILRPLPYPQADQLVVIHPRFCWRALAFMERSAISDVRGSVKSVCVLRLERSGIRSSRDSCSPGFA